MPDDRSSAQWPSANQRRLAFLDDLGQGGIQQVVGVAVLLDGMDVSVHSDAVSTIVDEVTTVTALFDSQPVQANSASNAVSQLIDRHGWPTMADAWRVIASAV
jgi:hypothetical protein